LQKNDHEPLRGSFLTAHKPYTVFLTIVPPDIIYYFYFVISLYDISEMSCMTASRIARLLLPLVITQIK